MTIKDLIDFDSNKYGEEAALMSVDLVMTSICDQWFRAYISPPGGAWQELFVEYDNKAHRFFISKDVTRVDLILQKSDTPYILFLIGEAKDDYKKVLANKAKINKCMLGMKDFITDLEISGEQPFKNRYLKLIFAFISGLNKKSFGNFANRVIINENELVKSTINDLEPSGTNRIVIVSYIDNAETKFILNFSSNFDPKLKEYLISIFKKASNNCERL